MRLFLTLFFLLSLSNFLPQLVWYQEFNINLGGYYLAAHLLLAVVFAVRWVPACSISAAQVKLPRLVCLINVCAALLYAAPLLPFYLPTGRVSLADYSTSTPLQLIYANITPSATETCARLAGLHSLDTAQIVFLVGSDENCLAVFGLETVFEHRLLYPRPAGNGLAIYSRLPLTPPSLLNVGEEFDWPILETEAKLPSGRTLRLAMAKAQAPIDSEANDFNALFLRRLAVRYRHSAKDMVMLIDLFATPFSPRYSNLIEIAGLANAMYGHGLLRSWRAGAALVRMPLDHILYKGDLTVESFARLPEFGSERLGFAVTFLL